MHSPSKGTSDGVGAEGRGESDDAGRTFLQTTQESKVTPGYHIEAGTAEARARQTETANELAHHAIATDATRWNNVCHLS